MSSISSFSKTSNSSIQHQNPGKPPPKFQKRSCPCNVTRCKHCNPNQPKLTNEEIKKIKKLNKKRTKPRALKYCRQRCEYCKNFCLRANYYIEQEILKYNLEVQANDKIQSRNSLEKSLPPKKQPSTEDEQIDYADNNKPIDIYFNTITIEGKGNCLFKSILEALNIEQSKHKLLRELAAKTIEEREWEEDTLKAININSPKELADQVRVENSFVGETTIIPLAEKLELTIAIYLKDTTRKWIKQNHKENQDIIYLEYTQGKYASLDLEGHYNTLKPKIPQLLKNREKIILILEEINKEQIEKNLLHQTNKKKM